MKDVARSADGIPVHFEVEGAGEPALVFVHGWSCDRTYWSAQIDHFAATHEVVAVDLAGHGESGGGRREWTMPAFGGDVVAVIEKLGLREVVLIGHSMGGDVIVEVALALPERIAGLVWVDVYRTLGGVDTPEEIEEFVAAVPPRLQDGGSSLRAADVRARFGSPARGACRRRHVGCTARGRRRDDGARGHQR